MYIHTNTFVDVYALLRGMLPREGSGGQFPTPLCLNQQALKLTAKTVGE